MPKTPAERPHLLRDTGQKACPIRLVRDDDMEDGSGTVYSGLTGAQKAWIEANDYKAKPGRTLLVPDKDGNPALVLFGAPEEDPFAAFEPAALCGTLPKGLYRFEGDDPQNLALTTLGWALEGYRFDEFKENPANEAQLLVGENVDLEEIRTIDAGATLARDLVNMPANVLGPAELADAALDLARRFDAAGDVIVGDDLISRNFPLVHAVGAASDREPRLVDFTWGDATHPKITLVGKGVCFDTGGLNIKSGSSMELMKKDMGGAANVLGLASMIMASDLPVRLRVVIPAVENAISGSAFRPGDVYRSRKGLTVEISNTDAEGRLVLADALALADEESPDLIIDMATLTGAARVATGPDLAPMYTDDCRFAEEVHEAGLACCDPVWRMPLWPPYAKMLSSKVADINHISGGAFAGSITAALFLGRFVENTATWAHFDIFAWTPTAQPARPQGGAAHAIRALFQVIKNRYPKSPA